MKQRIVLSRDVLCSSVVMLVVILATQCEARKSTDFVAGPEWEDNLTSFFDSSGNGSTPPKNLLEVLVEDEQVFREAHFEKAPVFFKSTEGSKVWRSLLPLNLIAFLLKSLDMQYEENVRLWRDGEKLSPSLNDGSPPQVSLTEIQQALLDGATVTFVNLHRLSPNMYEAVRNVQNSLSLPVELGVLLYPPFSAGRNPSAAFQDIIYAQVSGVSEIVVCERTLINVTGTVDYPRGIDYSVSDLRKMKCKGHTLEAGSRLYIPAGFVHYITTPDGDKLAQILVWNIDRQALSKGVFLYTAAYLSNAPPNLMSKLKDFESAHVELTNAMDTRTIDNSYEYSDLPTLWSEGVINDLRSILDPILINETEVLDASDDMITVKNAVEGLINQLDSEPATLLARTVADFRFKLVSGLLPAVRQSFELLNFWHGGSAASGMPGDTLLWRSPQARVSAENEHNIFAVDLDLMEGPDPEDLYALSFCLSIRAPYTAQGKVFAMQEIPLPSFARRKEIATFLISTGALAIASDAVVAKVGRVTHFPRPYTAGMSTNDRDQGIPHNQEL